MKHIYISNFCSWEPPKDEPTAAPKLEFTDPIFRRRLSNLSKMTIQVVHDLFARGVDKSTKIVFASQYGEITRQFKSNKTLIEEDNVLPAAFSLSTFNAPIALATIAEGLRGGYTAVYPSRGNFADAFLAAAAPILSGRAAQIVFAAADERIPENYGELIPADNFPFAFALLLSSQKGENSIQLNLPDFGADSAGGDGATGGAGSSAGEVAQTAGLSPLPKTARQFLEAVRSLGNNRTQV